MKRILIVLLIILTFSIGCIDNNHSSTNKKDSHFFEYILEIDTDSNSEFFMWVPLALEIGSNNVSEIMDYCSLRKGEGDFEIINTTFGQALNISTSEDIEIYSYRNEKTPYAYLSMSNNSIQIKEEDIRNYQLYFCWIYLFSDDQYIVINLDINLFVWNIDDNLGYSVFSTPGQNFITPGWNKISVGTSFVLNFDSILPLSAEEGKMEK